ncbi:MAG: phosphoribosylglycinamide formyltransferase [Bdellovibrionaceae bacterium]|nr:phosphoribosylglycinamide formyltransferase [Pseudobdellovibrionaceae bacterium]
MTSIKGTNLAILASGTGTNFKDIVESAQRNELPVEVKLLITDKEEIGAIAHAKNLQIPFVVIKPRSFLNFDDWDHEVAETLVNYEIEFVVLAGVLRKIGPHTLEAVKGQMINTHPSLLPSYGGKGMYGINVHKAVVENGEKVSGCTVHWVNDHYDEGQIIGQKQVEVLPDDTPESLASRVKAVENPFLIAVLKSVLSKNQS